MCSLIDLVSGKVGISNNNLIVGGVGVDYEEVSLFSVKIFCCDIGGLIVE